MQMRDPQMREWHPPPRKKRATKAKSRGAHDDECVGVDEEGTHSNIDSLVAPSVSSYDSDLAASSNSAGLCSDPEFDSNGEVFDDVDEYDPPFFWENTMGQSSPATWIN